MFLTSSMRCCASHRLMNCSRQHLPATQLASRSCAYSPALTRSQTDCRYMSFSRKGGENLTSEKSCICDSFKKPSDIALQSSSGLLSHQFAGSPCTTETNCNSCVDVGTGLSQASAHLQNLTAKKLRTSNYSQHNIATEKVSCANSFAQKSGIALNRSAQSKQCGGLLSLCDIRNILSSRTVLNSSVVQRKYSSLCSRSQIRKHYRGSDRGSCRRLLDNSGPSCASGAPPCRTNYMGNWDGPDYRKTPPWRILFFGTDFIALETLSLLYDNMEVWSPVVGNLEVVTVKAQMPVRKFAESKGLTIHNWPIKTDNTKYDVGVLVSFGHMIPDRIIHMFPYGILNMHPSVLPRWRGASPIIHAVLAGDTRAGVSITEIRPKHFDIGPILMQQVFKMKRRPTSLQLADALSKIGAEMVVETLRNLPTLERFEHEQDEKIGITYAHKISKQNGYIDWEHSTAEMVDRQYRALSAVVPIRTKWQDAIVSLHDVVDPELLKGAERGLHHRYKGNIHEDLPGTPVWHKELDCIVVKCKEGLIGFKSLTLRRPLSATDFHNGYLNNWDGTRFTSVDNELYRYVTDDKVPASSMA